MAATPASSSGGNLDEVPLGVSDEDRRLLLRTARAAAHAFLTGHVPPAPAANITGRFGGAFVTLLRDSELRGCVGTFTPTTDIVRSIQSVTGLALQDSRFVSSPITAEELDDLTIEVSLLTAPRPAENPTSLVVGVHGIVVTRGGCSGCFLPKVAVERNWTLEEFLSNCCTMKAGLPADAWRDAQTTVSVFRAEVFSDRNVTGA